MASHCSIKWKQAIWQIPAIILAAGILAFSANALRPDSLPLIGDWSIDARMTTVTGERLDIPLQEAEKLFRDQAVVFLDARSADDYARGHIRGARSLPWEDVDRFFMEVTGDLETETPIITYCDGETCNLSHDLALFLKDMGFMNVRVLVNGWTDWHESRLPVESSEGWKFIIGK
ncbi:MAG: rhodanese-like domain-containing protein [Desulfobacteraceae bacterium]|jgi:rhodanese-related sulfurtransferase|nr:rhodanese-like domain-containing protein [Desulfobacteraceae bacterium]